MHYVETSKADNILYIHEPYYCTTGGRGFLLRQNDDYFKIGPIGFSETWELLESYMKVITIQSHLYWPRTPII